MPRCKLSLPNQIMNLMHIQCKHFQYCCQIATFRSRVVIKRYGDANRASQPLCYALSGERGIKFQAMAMNS